MNYLTLEVEIEHGKVVSKGPEKLPEKSSGLLTILQPAPIENQKLTPLQALETLQKRLQLDEKKGAAWMETIRNARR
ncbi:MAG: hypothetical protein EXS31_14840 [Pedosphaera sp.]|nr:hypothetical protein [Pedosphaera sp.]